MARHRAPAVCHYVKEMARGRLSQFVLMKRPRRGFVESTTRDHAVAITRQAVTRGAEYLIALLPACENFFRDRKRKGVHVIGKHHGAGSARIRSASILWADSRHPACSFHPLTTASGSVTTLLAEIKLAVRAQVTTGHGAFRRQTRGNPLL